MLAVDIYNAHYTMEIYYTSNIFELILCWFSSVMFPVVIMHCCRDSGT